MTWDPLTQPIDHVLIGGQWTPGLAEITGASSPRRWDERKGYGLSGSRVVFRGVGLSKFSIKLRLLTPEDWRGWEEFRPIVQRPPLGVRARAVSCWHPFLEELEIKSLVVEELLQPVQTGEGEWTIEIKCIEWRRPRPALGVPDGGENPGEEPDALDLQIERMSAEANRLARELNQ